MAGSDNHHSTSTNWYQMIMELYPEALSRTYSVPPVYFNRVPYVRETVAGAGLSALILNPPLPSAPRKPSVPRVTNSAPVPRRSIGSQPPPPPQTMWPLCHWLADAKPGKVQNTDMQDDCGQAHVLRNLQALGDRGDEVMFILSQVNFSNYLNKPAYAAAAAQLPRPSQLNTAQQTFSRGDFDILVIHRHRGVLVGELKTVGRIQTLLNMTQADADNVVALRLSKAVEQLDKSDTVVKHLVSDIAPKVTVRKTVFLPFVSSKQLRRVLANNSPLEQALRTCLGANTLSHAVDLCCTSEKLSSPESSWDITDAVLKELNRWWSLTMNTTDPCMTDRLYVDMVARFVGPATTVRVHCSSTPRVKVEARTEGQAVAQLGLMLANLVLTRSQITLLTWSPQRLFICGPPGTGKTLVLVVQGLAWLRQKNDVHVVSTSYSNKAVSLMIRHQLETTLRVEPTSSSPPGRVLVHQVDLSADGPDDVIVESALRILVAEAYGGTLHVVMDEVNFDARDVLGRRCRQLVTDLASRLPDGLHIWCSGVLNYSPPPVLSCVSLTQPLRCAPVVLREVQQGVDRAKDVDRYTESGVPAPGDGLGVTRLEHQGDSHGCQWPVDCLECGRNVAAELRRLGVGVEETGLSYRDVLVITRSTEIQDEVTNPTDNVTSPASGVVQGLRGAGLSVCVLGGRQDMQQDRARWNRNLEDVALAASDAVTVAYYGAVTGLERRVVVYLPGSYLGDDGINDDDVQTDDRVLAMSRCTTQLIVITLPDSGSQRSRQESTPQ